MKHNTSHGWFCLHQRATFIHLSSSVIQLLIKQWSSSHSGSNNERKGPDSVLFTLLSHIQKISLSLSLSGCCRLSCSGPGPPQCIWYYSQLNVGFTEAAWIKRVTARTYLVLCNAVNRFAEWGFNVFLYTNIMSTSWNIIPTASEVTLWCKREAPSAGGSLILQ